MLSCGQTKRSERSRVLGASLKFPEKPRISVAWWCERKEVRDLTKNSVIATHTQYPRTTPHHFHNTHTHRLISFSSDLRLRQNNTVFVCNYTTAWVNGDLANNKTNHLICAHWTPYNAGEHHFGVKTKNIAVSLSIT